MARITTLALLLLTEASAYAVKERRDATPAPIPYSVPPSQYWDGDDGPWSTFSFQVGNPYQQVRLLASTSGKTFAPIIQTGCNANDTSTCSDDRGGLFNPNGSSTWSSLGTYTYTVDYSQEAIVGSLANAIDGTDQVQLSWPGSNGLQLQNQLVTSIAEKGIFYLGNFGISPRVSNISTLSNSHESPISALFKAKSIPSQSYGYTAGFYNTDPPAFGSLTLGGYDTTRFNFNANPNVSFPFGPDISRDLLVSIQQITFTSSNSASETNTPTTRTSLLQDPTSAFIDSTISTLYLPSSTCQAFEAAFNLTYNPDGNFYPLTTTQHANLMSLNPSITFTLGTALAGGSTISITVPYAAFDQTMNPPLGTSGLKYFPLQRANATNQVVLGRTFLQHAYLVADYDRQNFSVYPAFFPQGDQAIPKLTAIYPPDSGPAGNGDGRKLGAGVIAGIVVGVVIILAVLAGIIAFVLIRRRKRRRAVAEADAAKSATGAPSTDNELSTRRSYGVDEKTAELASPDHDRRQGELDGRTNGVENELDGKMDDWRRGTRTEMEGGHWIRELDATDDGKKSDDVDERGTDELGGGWDGGIRAPAKGRMMYELP